MRCFISLNIDTENKKNIHKIQYLLKEKINKPYLARFENSKNFHLTLFFIGEIGQEKLAQIYHKLKSEIENGYGELNFTCSEINAFPDLNKPRVLFLNCINNENKIFDLAEKIKIILSEYGYFPDKNFHPHVTLARVKGKINLTDLSDIEIDINFSVKCISIMESEITTKGAEHKELFSINL